MVILSPDYPTLLKCNDANDDYEEQAIIMMRAMSLTRNMTMMSLFRNMMKIKNMTMMSSTKNMTMMSSIRNITIMPLIINMIMISLIRNMMMMSSIRNGTFVPLEQETGSSAKYTASGFIPDHPGYIA